MKRLAFLAVVACLWGWGLTGTGRAGIIYDIYTGGTAGTLLAEYQVQDFINSGTDLKNFSPTVLTSEVGSPGELVGTEVSPKLGGEFALIQFSGESGMFIVGEIEAFLPSNQFPTSPGTFALDSMSQIIDKGGFTSSVIPDTLVISSTTATPEPASLTLLGLGAAVLAGYGWRRKRATT
jgi:hypothetical protein